jgi:transposase
MSNSNSTKLATINPETLIVGVDIAKELHWARFTDHRGLEIGKAIKFNNNRQGFENIVASMETTCKLKGLKKVIVGMEPTGHYWKPLANYLVLHGLKVVMINPYHTKRAKELDDNSPTKSDRKDSLTIARLVRDGRFYEVYLPQDVYAELRVLSNTRLGLKKRQNALKNNITAVMDEYFPEIRTVFKHPLKGKASLQILKNCPFPEPILSLGVEGVLAEIKKAVQKSVGGKKACELVEAAKSSIGATYGLTAAHLKLRLMIEELELLTNQLEEVEEAMSTALDKTGYKDIILSIPAVGVVSAASFLGEIGDPLRFEHPNQINRMAGYNLVEDSSGQNQGRTVISKRGRKNLRSILYQMALVMVAKNSEMKELYLYLKKRPGNPLKKKQALVVISKKAVTIIYNLVKKQALYEAELVFNQFRKNQIKEVA